MRSDVQAALATLRDELDNICLDSLETTMDRILANREWNAKQNTSAMFLRLWDALATVEQALTDKDAKYDALATEAWEDRGALADAQAEVARLRDALRKIAAEEPDVCWTTWMIDTARAALGEELT